MNRNINLLEKLLKRKERLDEQSRIKTKKRRAQKKFAREQRKKESTMRDQKAKEDFIKYLEEHPQERFWQAVRNFQHFNFIYASNKIVDDPDVHDTFYWEDLSTKEQKND